MDELISRQVLLDKFEKWQKTEDYSNDEWNLLVDVLSVIKSMPPAPQLSTNLAEVGTDCISRQAAIEAMGKATWAKERLAELPPAESKRGRWIGKYPITSVCSECGFLIHDSKVKAFAYCPNCGADMRGEQN